MYCLKFILSKIYLQVVHHHAEEGKEPYGPACRDYFWLVCRLIDGLPEGFFKGILVFLYTQTNTVF